MLASGSLIRRTSCSRGISSRAAMLAGCLFLFVGFGLAFLGSFRMTTAMATPGGRGSELSPRVCGL
jgi:hypothetical protein